MRKNRNDRFRKNMELGMAIHSGSLSGQLFHVRSRVVNITEGFGLGFGIPSF